MADEEQLAILKQGVAEWNEWRQRMENDALDFLQALPDNISIREVFWVKSSKSSLK